MKTKLFTFLLALVASVGTMSAEIIESVQIGDSYYNLDTDNQTAEVTKDPNKYTGDIVIPSTVSYNAQNYSVTSIGSGAFYNCPGLTSIEIPNSVTSIGNSAFSGCTGLTSVEIPNSVTSIGNYAFSDGSSLTSIIIPSSVTSIGEWAFNYCTSLTSIEIPNSVTSIGGLAFNNCTRLTSVTIGNSVTSIGAQAFNGCSGLTSIEIPNSVTSIGEYAFYGCSSLTSMIVESGNPMYDSRNNCNAIIETSSNTLIAGCQSTIIPNSVTSIGKYAFHECSSLTSVEIPNSVTIIGQGAFSGCSGMTSIDIPNSVTSIGAGAFEDCTSLTFIEIPNSVTSIGLSAFEDCTSLTSIKIPNSITSIGSYAFSGCKSLTSVTIPNSVTTIGSYAFRGCTGLTSVTIPNSVTIIEDNAFDGCSHLEEIEFGYSLETIGEEAFKGCSRVYQIICPARVTPSVGTDGLTSISDEAELYVPKDCIKKYQVDPNWKRFIIKEISANNTSVDDVVVNPSSNTANISWPVVENAVSYELVIKDKNGNKVCTLIFDAEGHLTSIAFSAPSRGDAPQQTQGAGFSFTVTGLEEGTEYNLTLTAKDNNGTTLDEKSMAFHTDWPEGLDKVQNDDVQSTKVIRDGKVFILRGDKVYTLQGQEVR